MAHANGKGRDVNGPVATIVPNDCLEHLRGRKMLEMRTDCERCGSQLKGDGPAAICSFECTFCDTCAHDLGHLCPNCGGELVRRPMRRG